MFPRKGLTLVEIIISLVILSLVVLGLVNLFISGSRYILHSRARMTAAEMGEFFLDRLQMDVRQESWGNNCLTTGTVGCEGAVIVDNISYSPGYNVGLVSVSGTNMQRVVLTVTWSES